MLRKVLRRELRVVRTDLHNSNRLMAVALEDHEAGKAGDGVRLGAIHMREQT